MMDNSKLMTLGDAVDSFIPDGSSVALGTCYESLIPFGAGQEIIRKKRRNLTLVGPISDTLFDQMVGSSCVKKIQAAWVGNVITGSGYNFRRAVEGGWLEVEDHSNFTISLALQAGAHGVPFMPSRTALGSDLFRTNPGLIPFACPVTGEQLVAVKAVTPDVAVIHLQRADRFGNSHMWGNLGITKEACLASRHIIITAEEIVEKDCITCDPGRVAFPGFRVSAVVHLPWGGYPSPVPGFYNRDHNAFLEYKNATTTKKKNSAWLKEWVFGVRDREGFMAKIPEDRKKSLAITHQCLAKGVNYGF